MPPSFSFVCLRCDFNVRGNAGACWLAGQLWQELQLDRFWADRLPPNRKGTRWDQILQVLASYRLIAPGSISKKHRANYYVIRTKRMLASRSVLPICFPPNAS